LFTTYEEMTSWKYSRHDLVSICRQHNSLKQTFSFFQCVVWLSAFWSFICYIEVTLTYIFCSFYQILFQYLNYEYYNLSVKIILDKRNISVSQCNLKIPYENEDAKWWLDYQSTHWKKSYIWCTQTLGHDLDTFVMPFLYKLKIAKKKKKKLRLFLFIYILSKTFSFVK